MSGYRLLVVDGTGVAYRAFHAIRGLRTRDGRPTNAIFGFLRALESERRKWRPTHWVVVFDGGRPSERVALLDTYKAQRKPMPDDLGEQLRQIDRFLELAGIPYVLIPGKEADDLIAVLGRRAERAGWEVVILSSDKDLLQLVSDRIRVAKPGKTAEAMGPADVEALTGVSPSRIPLWLALIGDPVDNIPGVRGIGPKKAAELAARFGSLKEIEAHLDDVAPERVREALRDALPVVARNLELIRLKDDERLDLPLEALAVRPVDPERIYPFLEEFELKSLLDSFRS
ncbi:MAG TPA: 5'-3' exonuclease [Kiritimatiellae bacterium]|nr:5'-3' exonuclease [Kiritimatiellia bacterium]